MPQLLYALIFITLALRVCLVGAKSKEKRPKYCVGRIVGSSLPGRHVSNQSQISLHDILDKEMLLAKDPEVHRFWLLNHMQSKAEQESIMDFLVKYPKIRVVLLPFKPDVFRSIALRSNGVHSHAIRGLSRSIADQVRYVTANNEARNAAIDYCLRIRATWILPLDGNILIPDEVWRAIRSLTSVVNDTIILPMKRQGRGQTVSPADIPSRYEEEPQIMFHSTTAAHFNERYMYGSRPKIDMLRRLCVPGYWDIWNYHEAKYDMDFDDMNRPCSLRQVAPPSLTMAVLRINDKIVNSSTNRVQLRNQGMRTAVTYTIANTMFHPQYSFWEVPYMENLRRKTAKSTKSALKEIPRPFMPPAERPGLRETFGNITQSSVRLRLGPTGKSLRDERDVVRAWVLDVLLASRTSIATRRDPTPDNIAGDQILLRLVPYFSDSLLFVSRQKDIFNHKERVQIQTWFRRFAHKLAILASASEKSPAKFHKEPKKKMLLTSRDNANSGAHGRAPTRQHNESLKHNEQPKRVPTSESTWRWIALLSTSPWVLHDIAEDPGGADAIYDLGGNNGTIVGMTKKDLRLHIAESIIELAHIVDISITVVLDEHARYVAMGGGRKNCALVTLQHLSGLLLATSLLERHGFKATNTHFCPAVKYFVADRTPEDWEFDCGKRNVRTWIEGAFDFMNLPVLTNLDIVRQRVYSQSKVVCDKIPKVQY